MTNDCYMDPLMTIHEANDRIDTLTKWINEYEYDIFKNKYLSDALDQMANKLANENKWKRQCIIKWQKEIDILMYDFFGIK